MEKVAALSDRLRETIVNSKDTDWDSKFPQDLQTAFADYRVVLSKESMMLDSAEVLDHFWDQQAKQQVKQVGNPRTRPLVGHQYDTPTQDDWEQLQKIFQNNYLTIAPETAEDTEKKQSHARRSRSLRGSEVFQHMTDLMNRFDTAIEEVLNSNTEHVADDQSICEDEGPEDNKKRRLMPPLDVDSHKIVSDVFSPKLSSQVAPSVSPTQVLFAFLQELQSLHFNYLDFARHYEPLRCCRLSSENNQVGASPSATLQPLGRLLAREQDCSLLQMEQNGVSSKARSVAKDFVRSLTEHLQAFDAQSAMSHSLHKVARRPVTFSFAARAQNEDALQIYDRIPNPFSSSGMDFPQWLWLSNATSEGASSHPNKILTSKTVCRSLAPALDFSVLATHHVDTDDAHSLDVDKRDHEDAVLLRTAERDSDREQRRRALAESANELFKTLCEDSDLISLHRRSAAKQVLSVLACGLGACLCVRDSDAGRSAATQRRSLLGCYVLSQLLEKDRERERDCCLLVLCKARDLEIWETSMQAAARHSPLGLQVLPYWGSDADRATARAFLRSPIGQGPLCMICSYDTLCMDVHLLREQNVSFSLCVWDEPWGLLSVSQYGSGAAAALLSLRTRQRLLLCSDISRTSTPARTAECDRPVSQSEAGGCDQNENETDTDAALGSQVPDSLCALLALCPFALGHSCFHSHSSSLAPSDDSLSNERSVTAFLSHNSVVMNLPSQTRDRDAPVHRERVDCDLSSRCMAARLAAALTVLCDSDLASLAESLSVSRCGPAPSADAQNTESTDADHSEQLQKERAICVDELNSLCLVLSALEWRGVERTYGLSEDDEQSSKNRDDAVQIYGFERTRSELFNSIRFIVRESEFSHDFRDVELDEELQHIVWASVGKSGSLPRVKDKSCVQPPSVAVSAGKGSAPLRGSRGGRGTARGPQGKGKSDLSADSTLVQESDGVENSQVAMTTAEGDLEKESSAGRGRGRGGGRGGGGSGRGGGRAGTKRASSLAVSAVVSAVSADRDEERDTMPSLSLEEEMQRYVVNRAGLWHASIITFGRQRCLGVFTEEWEAHESFRAAHAQRESLRRLLGPKHKTRTPREVKLTDGSNIAGDYYRSLSNEALHEEVRQILIPQQAIKMSLTTWIAATYHAPPSYAQLCGHQSLCVAIDELHVVLGRCEDDYDELDVHPLRTLVNALGANENVLDQGFCALRLPRIVHLGKDPSLARKHAQLDWDSERGRFVIRALSAAGLYVNGKHIRPEDSPEPLRHRSVVQIGKVTFYFLLPLPVTYYTQEEPMTLRRDIARSLTANLQLRKRIFANGESEKFSSVVELERDITSAIRNIDEKESIVMKRFVDGAAKARRAISSPSPSPLPAPQGSAAAPPTRPDNRSTSNAPSASEVVVPMGEECDEMDIEGEVDDDELLESR